MRKLAALFLATPVLLAAPAAAQMRAASLPDIVESYNDCFAATEHGSVSATALEKLGWSKGKPGSGASEGLLLFGHRERAPVILLSGQDGPGMCVVLARIESKATFEEFKEAFGGNLPEPNADGAILYRADNRPVRLELTGTDDEPSMSLAVGTSAEN